MAKKTFPPTPAAASPSLAGAATSSVRDVSCLFVFLPQKRRRSMQSDAVRALRQGGFKVFVSFWASVVGLCVLIRERPSLVPLLL